MQDFKEPKMNEHRIEIKPIVRPFVIIFILFWDIFLVIRIVQNPLLEYKYIFIGFGLFASFFIMKQLLAKLEIVITNDYLLIKNLILNMSYKSKMYLIKDIKHLTKKHSVNENMVWGSTGFYFYIQTPVILTFNYKNKKIEVGKSYSWLKIDETIHEIKRRQ